MGAVSTTGSGFTVSTTVVSELQPVAPTVPVIVYVVVLGGLASTIEPEVVFRPVEGLQLNEVPDILDETDKGTAGDPKHREFGTGLRTGSGLMVTVILSVEKQPSASVAVNVII
jgi:hypothetical protein